MALRLLLLAFFCVGVSFASAQKRPVLETRDGHLVIVSAEDKNITLLTLGNGTVSVNDIDLIEVSQRAHKAARVVEKWHAVYLRDLTANVERLIDAVEGANGLQYRLNILELGDYNTLVNSSTGTEPIRQRSQITEGDQVSRVALLHLRNRVDKLEDKFRTISLKLRADECSTNPCKNGGTCVNIYSGFQCICPPNWEGPSCTEDVDECENFLGTTLGCQNGAVCTNLPGSYRCSCSTGWHGIRCNLESSDCNIRNSRKLCGHGDCVAAKENELGYTCDCDEGWQSEGTNPACTKDIDECVQGHQTRCSLEPLVACINLPGGYKCGSCPPGYTGNGRHCVDIDECLVENGGCSTEPMVECENKVGTRLCGNCPSGYQGDGVSCTYVGICKINNGGCHPRATCLDGSAFSNFFPQCKCPTGYIGDGIGPEGCKISPGAEHPCDSDTCHMGVCIRDGYNSFHCYCYDGFTGTYCDIPIDPCSPNPCQNGGVCELSRDPEKFTCECTSDYSGETCQNERESCGGLFRSPTGTVKYPMVDDRAKDSIECAYVITTDNSKVLNITFHEFDLEPSENCESTFLQINDGMNDGAHRLGRYCNSSLPLGGTFKTTHNSVYILLRSSMRTSRRKFSFHWESAAPECGGLLTDDHGTISSPGSPGNYPRDRDCTWQVSVGLGKRIQFHFFSLMMEQHPTCDFDYLEINETASDKNILLGRFCNHSRPSPVLTSGSFAQVHFHSDGAGTDLGFQMSYSAVEGLPGCGGIFTADHGTITTPGYPAFFPPNIICEYKIQLQKSLRVRLSWLDMDLQLGTGCIYDSVEVFAGADRESPAIGKYCGYEELPAAVTINSNVVLIIFTGGSGPRRHKGFQLNYETICGVEFHESSGVVKSLHYPDSYPRMSTCVYEIVQPRNLGIVLNIVDMDILKSSACRVDRLEIYDGYDDKSPRLAEICGTSAEISSRAYYSTYNFMYLKFTTAGGLTKNRGFLANYTTFNRECGGILTATDGLIENSPVRDERSCTWIIKAPERHAVQITFRRFDLYEFNDNCTDNYVAIYDGGIGSDQEIGRYCSEHPKSLTSQGNIVTIIHNSTNMISDQFEILYFIVDTTRSCGGHYFSSTGLITTPNYKKHYPMHTKCEWVITVPNKRQVTLNIKDFEIADRIGCTSDSLEIRAGGSEASISLGKYCGKTIPKTIRSLTNQMYLKFVSHSNDQRGFSIEWDSSTFGCGGTLTGSNGEIFSPNYPQPYQHLASCFWKIRTNAGNLLRIIFVDLDVRGDETCTSDYIEISTAVDGHQRNNTRYCDRPPSSVNLQNNVATIQFTSDHRLSGRGFHIRYESTCNHKVRGFNGIIESPNFPFQYPGDVNCSWIIEAPKGNKIDLMFTHFRLPAASSWHPNCPVNAVTVKEGTDGRPNKQIGLFCYSDRLPERIISTQNQIFLNFKASEFFNYEGFRLEWRVVGCGGHLLRPSGNFSSPGYPDAPPASVECEWLIEVNYGHSVEIELFDLHLENAGGCRSDRVELYGGIDADAPMLAKLCYSENPVKYTSPTNKMFVKFTGDALTGRGWRATYKTVQVTCGGTFRGKSGVIHSANYPLNYPNNQNCEWLIQVDKDHTVNLNFTSFDIEDTTNCTNDYVKVFDGPSRDATLLGTFCRNELPPAIISTGNTMLVVMRSDSRVTAKGFRAQFEKACGALIVTNGTGVLDAVLDPQASLVSRICSWTIVAADPGDHVTLSISHMSMAWGSSPKCNEHSIGITEGDGRSKKYRDIWCTGGVPQPVTSVGNSLTIRMIGSNRDRFAATYSVLDSACGGEHLAAEGFISSPGFPHEYPVNVECVWLLKTSPGSGLRLTFSAFELQPSPNCELNYLEIRKDSAIGELIGVYCTDGPPAIVSSKNLWIKLRTDDSASSKGFMANYVLTTNLEFTGTNGEIASPVYPYPWKGQDVSTWRVTVAPYKAIRVEFDDLHIVRDDSCALNLAIYDGYDSEAPKLASVRGLLPPKDPIVSSGNVIFLQFGGECSNGAENWFHLNWYQMPRDYSRGKDTITNYSECVVEYDLTSPKNNSITFASPEGYNSRPEKVGCTWVVASPPGSHLRIKFHVPYQTILAPCRTADNLVIYNGNGIATTLDDSQILKKLCLKYWNLDETIEGGALLTIKFHVNRFETLGRFETTVWRECGGELGGSNGVIDSEYMWSGHAEGTPNVTCEWFVTVHRGRTIEVKFDEFSVGNNEKSTCNNNFILLKNGAGADSPLLNAGKFCNQSMPPETLETTGNKLYVKAVGGFPQQMNFKLAYREVLMSCGGSFRLNSKISRATFNSPNYPNIPPLFSECVWTFLAPAGERLTLRFVDRFDLTTNSNCREEYVEVRDGGTEQSESLGVYCGNSPPDSIVTTGNMLRVKFYSETLDPKNGFNATVTSEEVCGKIVKGEKGVVESPNYPHSYPADQKCSWTIVGPPGHTLAIEFSDLDLPSLDNCEDTDYVTVSQASPFEITDSSLGRWCGSGKPTLIETSSNVAIVSFTSGNVIDGSHRGFRLNYTASKEQCGGEFSGISGSFQSIGYPNPSVHSRSCKWSIMVPIGSFVMLNVSDLRNVLQENRLAFYNDKDAKSEIPILEKSRSDDKVLSSSNHMLVVYESSVGRRGFKAQFVASQPAPCGGLLETEVGSLLPPKPPFNNSAFFCQWKLEAPRSITDLDNGTTLTLLVSGSIGKSSYQTENCQQQMKYVAIRDHLNTIRMICGDVTQNVKVFRTPSPINVIDVLNGTLRGHVDLKINFFWKACGGILTGPSHTIVTPKNMTFPRSCAWHVKYDDPGAVISLNFKRADIRQCREAYISVRNGGPSSPLIATFCDDTKLRNITSSRNELWIEYWAIEPPGDFEFDLNLASGSCGGTIRGSTKEITSPGFPERYPNSAECSWELITEPGYTVGLTFVDRFHLESSEQCANDFVQIFNWVSNSMGSGEWDTGTKYCGRTIPPIFNSTSDRAKVLFRSNDRVQGDGFRARWDENCGGIFEATDQVQSIKSPGYPNSYPPNQKCNYTILAPPGKEVVIAFLDFEMESADELGKCKFDNLTFAFYDMDTFENINFRRTNEICGSDAVKPVYVTGTTNVIFQSDAQVQKRGYLFQFGLTDCGGVITEPSQLRPPTKKYGNQMTRYNCKWIIKAPAQKSVVFQLEELNIPPYPRCLIHELSVVEGDTLRANNYLMDTCFPTPKLPASVKSIGNVITVILRSDGNLKRPMSARVTFSNNEASGCGGKIHLENATSFRSQRTPIYEPFEDCRWIVTVKPGQNVRLTIHRMDLKNATNAVGNVDGSCNGDYLELRDGSRPTSELIGRFCGKPPQPVTSSTNDLWISFHTDGSIEGEGVVGILEPIDSPCGEHYREISDQVPVVIESPGYPADYPAGIVCRWLFRDKNRFSNLIVHFDQVEMEDTPNCDGDRLEISHEIPNYFTTEESAGDTLWQRNRHFRSENSLTPYKYCGKATSITHHSDNNELHVLLKTTTKNLPKARKFKFEVGRGSCNRNYTAEQGRIVLVDIKNCWTTITAPPNHTIALYINNFAVAGGKCQTNFLKVYDGDFGSKETTICSTRAENYPIFSTGNKLSIYAQTDGLISHYSQYTTTDLQYTTTDKGRGCGGKMYSNTGTLTSPMYPGKYEKQGSCQWEITVPRGYVVRLKFAFFDLGSSRFCQTDFLQIREENSDGDAVLLHCPGTIPADYTAHRNKLAVVYHSSGNSTGTGWKIHFYAIQEKTIDEESSL